MAPKSAVLAGIAAAGLVLTVPAAAWAAPASSHQPTSKHSATHDRLAGPRRATQQALSAGVRQVAGLQSQAANAALSDDSRAQLDAELQAATDALNADLAAVPQAASVAALNGLKQAGRHTVAVARQQADALLQVPSDTAPEAGD